MICFCLSSAQLRVPEFASIALVLEQQKIITQGSEEAMINIGI
jgi:hypothetical protein